MPSPAIVPLIDARGVRQAALGRRVEEVPAGARRFGPVKAAVIAVYPVDHPENRLGQTVCDLQPQAALPILRRVPIATAHAHQETAKVTGPGTIDRQPYDPKKRNRMEGVSRDLRPGTLVWVDFLGGDLHEPVVLGMARFNEQGKRRFPVERQIVDCVDAKGRLVPREVYPLDADLKAYPRAVDVYNGTRVETDNRGNYWIQTTTDRAPVFPGHNRIPKSPDPEGNYGVSTRGAKVGNIMFTSGRHPELKDDEPGPGLQGRQTLAAKIGSILDHTASEIGDHIRRARKGKGRFYSSSKGSDPGWHYAEDARQDYLRLEGGTAELHGEDGVTLDSDAVHLGSSGASDNVVLWPQLNEILTLIFTLIDTHIHTGVETGDGETGGPVPIVAPLWSADAQQCRSDVVFADKDAASDPTYKDDPAAELGAPADDA